MTPSTVEEALKPYDARADIGLLRRFQRHNLLRQFGEDGAVRAENVAASGALDRLIEAVAEVRPHQIEAQGSEPVAWRVKDFADGWILFHTEGAAQAAGRHRSTGNLVQPLYVTRPDPSLGSREAVAFKLVEMESGVEAAKVVRKNNAGRWAQNLERADEILSVVSPFPPSLGMEGVREAWNGVLHWANSRCPCGPPDYAVDEPKICPLCRADVDNPSTGCMALENTIPAHLLLAMRQALASISTPSGEGEKT